MSASFYDLQKFAATGQASADMTAYDKMRALAAFGGGKMQTLTGQPPLSFKANGKPLISWSMLGNGQRQGTPTPDAPIQPEFVGVRTENLFDENYPNISGTIRYIPLYVGEGSFTLSTTIPYDSSVANVFLLSGDVSTGASTSGNGAWKNHSVTAQSDGGYVTIAYRHYNGTTSPADCKTMLNSGSTPLPYEPYGWAEKITCAGQTVPIYLGEVPTVRRIKKLVLTGEEDWIANWRPTTGTYATMLIDDTKKIKDILLCTHLESQNYEQLYYGTVGISTVSNDKYLIAIRVPDTVASNDTEFKAYLQQQYAAGTPVTVWYVLAKPETGIVNEPLCKIGDYADELHSEDAGLTIPTAKGQNTLTVETELQPSSMTITYR